MFVCNTKINESDWIFLVLIAYCIKSLHVHMTSSNVTCFIITIKKREKICKKKSNISESSVFLPDKLMIIKYFIDPLRER